jgi:aromatic ring hydroxylase
MSLKTPEQYKESLQKLRPNLHKFGEVIQDVTTHPATRGCIEGHAQLFASALNPE